MKLYGKESIRKSLGTTDKSKARLLTGQLVALYETEFASHRKAMNPETLHIVTPTMRDQLCERIKWRMLDGDDTRRHEPGRLLGFLTAMEFSAPPRHFLPHEAPDYLNPADVGLNPKRIERLRQIETFLDRWMTEEMTFGHLELAQVFADRETRPMGYLIDWTNPGNRMALVYIMRAVVGSFRMAARRSHGDLVDTPNEPALALPAPPKAPETITPAKRRRASSGQTLFDVADLWAADGPKKTDAIEKTQRALRLLKESGQPVALHDTTRLSGLAFKRFLLEPERGFSGVTAGKHWHCVMAILNYAAHELAVIDANPWKGTAAPTGQASKCKVWSVEQLQRLFATSLFTAYELPEDRKAGADAAYWLQPRGVSAAGRGGFEIPGACPAEGLANGEALTITQAPGTPGGPSTPGERYADRGG